MVAISPHRYENTEIELRNTLIFMGIRFLDIIIGVIFIVKIKVMKFYIRQFMV